MKTSSAFRLAVVMVVILVGQQARGVTGPNAVATNGFPWVVPLSFGPSGQEFLGSASYITNGVVLTCSHNVNSANLITAGAVTNPVGFTVDRVAIGGQRYAALGVLNPLYANLGSDPNDIGLYLVLNAPAAPGGSFPVLATSADRTLTTGDTISVLGYGQSAPGGLPIYGTMTMTNDAATSPRAGGNLSVTANRYTFVKPPSSELTDAGDSGGPYLFNYGGTMKIVAVHTTGYTTGGVKTGAGGVRVDSHTDFVTGNGQNIGGGNYLATLDRLNGPANTTWSAAASWGRASTNFAAVPQNNDVAILDPTANSDAGTIVNVDVDTASLNGLLNDVTLQVNGHALKVTGNSGVLNGGNINVGGGAGSVFRVGNGVDNEGTVTIGQNANAYFGSTMPTGYVTFNTALFNGSNATVTVTAGGSLGVTNGDSQTQILNAAPNSLISIQGGAADLATLTANFFDNYGTNQVSDRGLLQLDRGFFNEITGQFLISGGPDGMSTGNVASLVNLGGVNISTGATVLSTFQVLNCGSLTVAGGGLSTTNFTVTFVTNYRSDLYTNARATTTGQVTMTSGNIGITNAATKGILDVQTGTFTMNGGNLSVDNMFVTNAATSRFFLNGGSVTSKFAYISNGNAFYVGSNSTPASLTLINGPFGSAHVIDNGLNIAVTPDATGAVTLAATLLTVTNGPTIVGQAGTGFMTISNGNAILDDLVVGNTNGSQGTFYNTPTGATTINNSLNIGAQSGSTGTVLVTGGQFGTIGTSLVFGVFIGNAGVGSMIVSNGLVPLGSTVTEVGYTNGGQGYLGVAGGTVTVNSFTIGSEVGATGNVFVSSGTLNATNGVTGIGIRGVGSMTVTGGQALLSSVLMGNSGPAANGTLTVSGGTVSLGSYLAAGDGPFTKGALWVTGGAFNAGDAQIDVGVDGLGLMTVSNGMASVGTLTVARDFLSSGSLTVAGGTLTVANWLHVADNLMSTGSVLVTGGSLSITNGPTIIGNAGSGRLTISNSTVQARDVTLAAQLGSSATLTLNNGTLATVSLVNNTNGFIMGVGTIDGPVTNAGTISPGFSPGKIFITGKLTLQPSSTVVMELGGTADAEYDHIIISNALQADGTLDVSLINAFTPASGDTFDIFGFTSSSGEFAITNLPALNPGLSWDTSNLMSIGELAVVPEPSSLLLVFAACSLGVLLFRRRPRRGCTG